MVVTSEGLEIWNATKVPLPLASSSFLLMISLSKRWFWIFSVMACNPSKALLFSSSKPSKFSHTSSMFSSDTTWRADPTIPIIIFSFDSSDSPGNKCSTNALAQSFFKTPRTPFLFGFPVPCGWSILLCLQTALTSFAESQRSTAYRSFKQGLHWRAPLEHRRVFPILPT